MIQLIVTGGTFDKTYDHIKGELYFDHTHIPKMLERSRCKLAVHVTPLLLKDSLAFTEDDLLRIEKACKNTSAKSIVITHGTDTVVNTAKLLARLKLDKTIVLTGAMIPYAFGSSSDGFFNLGWAFLFHKHFPTIYISPCKGNIFYGTKSKKTKI
jgi:L-asparaginase